MFDRVHFEHVIAWNDLQFREPSSGQTFQILHLQITFYNTTASFSETNNVLLVQSQQWKHKSNM